MKLLTKEQQESYENAKVCYICSENIKDNRVKNRGATHSICDLKYATLKAFQ